MEPMTDEEFEAAIEEALDAMPEQFLEALQNIAIVWEHEPNAYHLYGNDPDGEPWGEEPTGAANSASPTSAASSADPTSAASASDPTSDPAGSSDPDALPDDLLGLFDGLSIVERANGLDDDIPDVITVFKGPHERCFSTREELVEEIGKTIIHELGHYFGLEDDRLYDMGY